MLDVHPIIADMPALTPEEYVALRADIEARGQEVPIVLHEGMIWDGRARYDICRDLKRDPWLVPLRREHASTVYVNANLRRLGAPSSPERAAFVAAIGRCYDKEHLDSVAQKRRAWLSQARADFAAFGRSPRRACEVCESHTDFVHAHHSFPLALQFECGVVDPYQDHQWLCPVHHNRVHMFLSGYLLGARDLSFLDSIPDEHTEEWLAIERVAQVGINLCCEALGGGKGKKGRFDPPHALFIVKYARDMFPWPRPAGW